MKIFRSFLAKPHLRAEGGQRLLKSLCGLVQTSSEVLGIAHAEPGEVEPLQKFARVLRHVRALAADRGGTGRHASRATLSGTD